MTNMIMYQRPAGSGDMKWKAKGRPVRDPAPTTPVDTFPARYVEGQEPWRLQNGESHLDNMPSGVTVVNSSSYSNLTDFYNLMSTIDSSASDVVYVQLEAKTYFINSFFEYGTKDWRGWANVKKKVLGFIGAPRVYDGNGNVTAETVIQIKPEAVSNTPGAVDDVLNATQSLGLHLTGIYLSNSNAPKPLFVSGVTFRGTLQTPFSTYSSASQAYFRKNQTAASPLAWNGISIWGCQPGSIWQFCRFQGFGFALNTAPPFECGVVNSNRNNGLLIQRTEVDGRIAPSIDAARPAAAGGWMWNKETLITMKDSWQHHTRRSGWATNSNTVSENEHYIGDNFQCERIADTTDSWAGDNGGFNGANVEGIIGLFEFYNVRLNVTTGSHINWAVPYSGVGGTQYYAPNHVVIKLKGFRTSDTLYGGCLRIAVNQRPNSTGISPIWQKITDSGIAGSGLFDIRDENNVPLIGIKKTDYNASIHKPSTHFIVSY